MNLESVIRLLVSILACFIAAGIGSIFTFKSVRQWYPNLIKPRYTPPNWVFGPVWFILYSLMAVSVFLIWQQSFSSAEMPIAFILFWIQLLFNALWSIVFFGFQKKGSGVITIIILWFLILATIIFAFHISTVAGVLLIPYILWVGIAVYLNTGVWLLNKSAR